MRESTQANPAESQITSDTVSDTTVTDGHRDLVITVITNQSGFVPLEDLARLFAKRWREGSHPTDTDVEQAASLLHHTYLPELAAIGILEYDPLTRRAVLPCDTITGPDLRSALLNQFRRVRPGSR